MMGEGSGPLHAVDSRTVQIGSIIGVINFEGAATPQ